MTDEERNALSNFKFFINYKDFTDFYYDDAEIIYKLIEKQQEEIEKKDNIIKSKDKEIKLLKEFHNKHIKIINKMATECSIQTGRWENLSNEDIIEYFINKVEEENK